MLGKHRGYRQWVSERFPGSQTPEVEGWLSHMRSLVPKKDTVHYASDARTSLRFLLDASPANNMAREYLLCYDLLVKDLDSFIKDYGNCGLSARVYQEGILIYLASNGILSEETVSKYPAMPPPILQNRSCSALSLRVPVWQSPVNSPDAPS